MSNHFGPALFAVYSLGTLQLPLMGLLQEAANSVLITRVSSLQKRGDHREIVLLLARAARKLAAVYFPVYVFLMVAGREFIRVLFTARFADSWPIFALNLTLLPLGIVLLDPLYRAYQRERYFLLRLRLALAAILIATLWLFTARLGLLGVIAVVVLIAVFERAVMAMHFARLLGVTARDVVLLRDIGKLAVAALAAGVVAWLIRVSSFAGRRSGRAGGMRRGVRARLFAVREQSYLGGRQLAIMADGKIADPQTADGDANQLEDLASNRLDHPADLPVAPLVNGDLDEGVLGRIADAFHLGRCGGAIVQHYSIAQLLKLFVAEQSGRL